MRHFLFIPCLFAYSFLLAQSKTPEYLQYQNAAQVQKPSQADCYVRKFDAGTSAFRRGDYRAALRLFEEAKTCPEAQSSARRIKQLGELIETCQAKLGINKLATAGKTNTSRRLDNLETTGRKFNISPVLTRNTDPNCFQLTVKEADRAYRDSCWDDAAKLYRAAKNCADANQIDRERMSNRIEACRASAEDELLQKEQKAVRTARHAIAANRADDAMDLLRQGDRSLAWRLADFANFYIAPDDNPDCLEAMYATYLFLPPANELSPSRPPFCYHLSENLGNNVQFKFARNKYGEQLIAFVPDQRKTITWELPSMKTLGIFSFEFLRNPIGFDISPDGSLLFYGENYFYLPNGQYLELPYVTKYCFSDDGDTFFYENYAMGVIDAVNLNQYNRPQLQRKAAKSIGRSSSVTTSIDIQPNLLTMQHYNGELWLGYADRVEVLSRIKPSGDMVPRITWFLADSAVVRPEEVTNMRLIPATRELIVTNQSNAYYYFLNYAPDNSNQVWVVNQYKMANQLMAATSGIDTLLTVSTGAKEGTLDEIMTVESPGERVVSNKFYTKTNSAITISAAISDDGHWIVGHASDGLTRLWSLQDTCVSPPINIETYEDQLSPNGNHLFSKTMESIKIFDADDLEGGAQQEIKTSMTGGFLPEGASNKWAVFLSTATEIAIQQIETKQLYHFNLETNDGRRVPFAFDETESRYFAYSPGNGVVTVKSIADGSTLFTRNFLGEVTLIRSIPGSNKLLVVTRFINGNRFTVKVWDLAAPEVSAQVVRLQGYPVEYAVVSDQGDRLALSNGMDVRIFKLDNLNDEAVVIKPLSGSYINDIAFRPDGLALVSGDLLGNVVIWDVASGQSLLHFSNVWEGQKYPIDRLAFAYGGSRLRLHSPGRLFTANLDAYTLRDVVQAGERWLTSFTPQQIRDYNLEIAFKYPGNFDRLAESGDFPLIRSFFQYFRDQSNSSNNIEQVRTYCERAFRLFELLDAIGQGNLQLTLLEMYENYILKLLLRNETEEATRVVMLLEQRFDRPTIAILSAAHCSLIRYDLKAATRLYTDYLLRVLHDDTYYHEMEDVNTKLLQFQAYDLLDSAQVNCLCEVFQQVNSFESLCPLEKKYTLSAYSEQVSLYRAVFDAIDSTNNTKGIRKSRKVQVLEKALGIAKTLEYPNPVVENHPLEAVVIALSNAYMEMADFEQNSLKTPGIYQKTIDLLEKMGPFKSTPDTARLNHLYWVHNRWGQYLLEIDKPVDAELHFNAALQASRKLVAMYEMGSMAQMQMSANYLYPVYLALCKTKLLEGKAVEARKAFDQANEIVQVKRNSVLLAHAHLLENDETSAFLEFGNMTTAQELGEALFFIEQMADLNPMYRLRLMAFIPKLRDAFLGTRPAILLPEVNFNTALSQTRRYAAQNRWDSAAIWSAITIQNSAMLASQQELADLWRYTWYEQCLNYNYYLLCAHQNDTAVLSEVIRISREIIDFDATNEQSYQYRFINYFYPNLAHALWLRNRPGDRDAALVAYRAFFSEQYQDPWEVLQKDFIALHRAGLQWPDLKYLIQQLQPKDAELTPEDLREMGE